MWRLNDKIRYKLGRARLAGLLTVLPVTICFFVLALNLYLFAKSEITSSSVSVSGYYRSDGTYVHSYHRRPPGSREHDRPYETLAFFSLAAILGSIVIGGITVYRYHKVPDKDLLPYVDVGFTRPPEVKVPHKLSYARKHWVCGKCRHKMYKSEQYHYYESEHGRFTTRYRFCEDCYLALKRESKDSEPMIKKYDELYLQRYNEQYRHYFGSYPENRKAI